jgi:hypothetical protein
MLLLKEAALFVAWKLFQWVWVRLMQTV